jgi:DNA-binding Lrp family transcriptional regulator
VTEGVTEGVTELDAVDRALLERMQAAFPLVPRPFAVLGEGLGLNESDVLARVRRLKKGNIIRQIGAIFDTRRLGYQSTLVAFHVRDGALEDTAAPVNAHPGVSHNYARPHHYNLWFTLAVPPGQDVEDGIARLAKATGVDDWLNLPALRVFKIRTHFKLDEDHRRQSEDTQDRTEPQRRDLTSADVPFVRALQQDLPIVLQPFAETAGRLGLSEEELLEKARELRAAGIMRRFSAVLRHRRVGYAANGMACWVVPESRIEEVGQLAATYPQVSHCYERPAYPPRWPYTLFTMIHGQTKDRVETVVAQISQDTGIEAYEVLYSTREFKKERVRYFEEET